MTAITPGASRRLRLAAVIAAIEASVLVPLNVSVVRHLLTAHWFTPLLFRKDLGIPDSSKIEGIDKFAAFMANLSTPLLVALAAIAPLALIIGAGLLMFGARRAGAILAGTVGALALAACASGLVS
jgi:hypothetical protein